MCYSVKFFQGDLICIYYTSPHGWLLCSSPPNSDTLKAAMDKIIFSLSLEYLEVCSRQIL